jgi:voltage-gated potassium channel Kch
MPKVGFGRRFRYWVDNMTSRGTEAMIVMLFFMTLILIVSVALFVTLSGTDPGERGFVEVAWAGLMRTLDAGTMGGDEGSPVFLIAMLVITIGGIFVVGTLIGIITNGIDAKMEKLRKGRSFVAETDHTIILGWSPQIFTVISELVEANASRRHACIAVLAEHDKVEMDDEIRSRIPNLKTTRVVCRTGSPLDLVDLEIVNHHEARSIIILSPSTGDPDSCVIKTVLALVNNPARRQAPYHIVGTLRDPDNLAVAEMVGGDEVQLILAGDLIARISAQTCRQSGLAMVYTELLDYGGAEIYFKAEPSLAGRTYRDVLHAYEDSSLIGLRREDGSVQLNPPADTVLQTDDLIIAISEDDDTIVLSTGAAPVIREEVIISAPREETTERTLILGWNLRVPIVIRELDGYVRTGSSLKVVAETGIMDVSQLHLGAYRNMTVEAQEGCTTDRELLDSLDIGSYHHVIVQSYSEHMDTEEADARTLITLLHLRNIRDLGGFGYSIVTEMLDDRNRQLAEVTNTDDFIVSDKLVSLMLTQVSENRELKEVFRDLFDPEGSEVYLRPAEMYVKTGVKMSFHTVVASAARMGETAIGYRLVGRSDGTPDRILVNPVKSAQVEFLPGDRVIVLAED